MNHFSLVVTAIFMFAGLFLSVPDLVQAGDCTVRDSVEWQATIISAVYVRTNCPTGDALGVVPAGEKVRVLEVDRYREFYLIETSVGTGFVYSSFLNVVEAPLDGGQNSVPKQTFAESLFPDLDPNHQYYDEIADVTARGIVSGTDDGFILADQKITRAALAKILVEATTEQSVIDAAVLPNGFYADADESAWYAKYLKVAYDKGIMRGDIKRVITVRPSEGAVGGEVAKMIAEAFELTVPEYNVDEHWYTRYMQVLSDLEVLPYDSPTHPVTRGEMMYIVSKLLEKLSA